MQTGGEPGKVKLGHHLVCHLKSADPSASTSMSFEEAFLLDASDAGWGPSAAGVNGREAFSPVLPSSNITTRRVLINNIPVLVPLLHATDGMERETRMPALGRY